MRKIRIGNDIAVQWSLVAKGTGEPFVVEGKDISLSLKSIFATTEIEDFTAQGNTIAWTFKGAEQKQTGIYSLVVSVVDARGAMVTTDVCQFVELVACSCEANGADDAGVQTESIDLISSIEGASYDDTELRKELTRLDGELTELSAEVSKKQDTISDLETIRSGAAKGATAIQEVKTINGQSIVGSGNIEIQGGGGGGGASNEWKCVYDGRMPVDTRTVTFSTYKNGEALQAQEVVVQVIKDVKAVANDITGYVMVTSTKNKTQCLFGSIEYAAVNQDVTNPLLSQVRLVASPFYMIAEISPNVKSQVATQTYSMAQGGNTKPNFQVYEDIVSVTLSPNVQLQEAEAPYIKIYAR